MWCGQNLSFFFTFRQWYRRRGSLEHRSTSHETPGYSWIADKMQKKGDGQNKVSVAEQWLTVPCGCVACSSPFEL